MKKIVSVSLLTTILIAENIPNSSSILKELENNNKFIEKKKEILSKEKQNKSIKIDRLQKDDNIQETNISQKTIFIKDFKITNVKNMNIKYLYDLTTPYKNKNLTFTELTKITQLITKAYRDKGYFTAMAYIPKKRMIDNRLEISVVEGKYGNFLLENESRVKNSVISNIFQNIKSHEILNQKDFERGVLLINNTPGVNVSNIQIKAGSDLGTSDFVVSTESTPFVSGYALIDNQGSRYTGKNKLTVNTSLNSPFKIGDKLTLNGILSDSTNLKNGLLSYSFPLMPNGLMMELGYSQANYKLAKEYKSLNAYGDSKEYNIGLSYPIIKSRKENLDVELNYSKKSLEDYANGSQTEGKDIDVGAISLNYSNQINLLSYKTQFNSILTFTSGAISRTNDSAENDNYHKVNLNLNNTVFLNQDYQTNITLNFQQALQSKNLDGSEDMSLGGISGVKVYSDSVQSAENGYVINLELLRTFHNIKSYTHQIGLFYDVGSVDMADSSKDSTFQSYTLQDIGVNYNVSYKEYFFRSYLAYKIGRKEITVPNDNSRFLFQLGMAF